MISEKLNFWNSEDLITLDGLRISVFQVFRFSENRPVTPSHEINENTVKMISVRHDTLKN